MYKFLFWLFFFQIATPDAREYAENHQNDSGNVTLETCKNMLKSFIDLV